MKLKKTISIGDIYTLFKKYGDLNLDVLTPYGYKHIEACEITAKNSPVIKLTTDNSLELLCSPDHKIKTLNGRFVSANRLLPGHKILSQESSTTIKTVQLMPYRQDLLDIQVSDVRQYYSNGIVSHNSAILDSLAYCIFDKSSRGTKGSHIMNNKKDFFECKFNFEIKGVNYHIHRTGKRKDNGSSVKGDVDFYRIVNGQTESLNGEERDETNKIIRSYLGTYDDFILTALSLQNNNTGFIDMAQSQRKDLLSKFLDIGIFEDLYEIAALEISDTASALRRLKKEDWSQLLSDTQTQIGASEGELQILNEQKDNSSKELFNVNEKHTTLLSQYKPIDSGVINLTKLTNQKLELNKLLKDQATNLITASEQIKKYTDKLNGLLDLYPKVPDNIQQGIENLILLETKFEKNKQLISRLLIDLKHKQEKLKKLEEHKYDPDCKFCMDNVFVKDAIETKKTILVDETKLIDTKVISDNLKKEIAEHLYYRTLQEALEASDIKIKEVKDTLQKISTSQEITSLQIKSNESQLLIIEQKIKDYHLNETAIKHNIKLDEKVLGIKKILSSITITHNETLEKILHLNGQYQVQLKTKTDILDKIKELQDLETYYEAYERYLAAVSRDGIPYDLISSTLPKIEHEVNNILSQMVDFTITFNTDGKNINAYIVYDDTNFWLLELTSGMEKFISSLAIRNALISISNLPRPNFLAIDEGLGALDAEHLSQMFLMLDYLKDQYEFIIMISHLDSTKDMVDKLMEIQKEGSFSKIIH